MARIWTPEALTPEGWDPDEWLDVNTWSPDKEPSSVVECRIIRAAYHRSKETIALQIRAGDGMRVAYLHKSNFMFRGRKHSDVPREETDKEMEKTTAMMNARAGTKLRIRMYQSQLERR
jgi:hypothetical protein